MFSEASFYFIKPRFLMAFRSVVVAGQGWEKLSEKTNSYSALQSHSLPSPVGGRRNPYGTTNTLFWQLSSVAMSFLKAFVSFKIVQFNPKGFLCFKCIRRKDKINSIFAKLILYPIYVKCLLYVRYYLLLGVRFSQNRAQSPIKSECKT